MKKILGFFVILAIILVSVYVLKFSAKRDPKLVVVNVLDKNLYDDCHIKGSVSIPFEEVQDLANKLDKNDHIIFYCSNYMCTASGQAAKDFKKLGFKNVWAYEAGMAEWYQQKLPVEGACKQAYLNAQMAKPQQDALEDGVEHITTADLHAKMKEMLNI